MYAYAYVCMYTYMCIFFAVSVACTLEQVFWAPVHVQLCTSYRCFLDINIHICDTFAAGCSHMCMFNISQSMHIDVTVYMHTYVYGCVCASMMMSDALRLHSWDFLPVYRCVCTRMCICVCMYACIMICACAYVCICIYVCLCICMHIYVYAHAHGCTYALM